MSKLSSLMVMIGICAFLGNKPTWAGPGSSVSPSVTPAISGSSGAAREVQFAPAVAEQFEHAPSLIAVGAIVIGGLGVMSLRRKSA